MSLRFDCESSSFSEKTSALNDAIQVVRPSRSVTPSVRTPPWCTFQWTTRSSAVDVGGGGGGGSVGGGGVTPPPPEMSSGGGWGAGAAASAFTCVCANVASASDASTWLLTA